MIKVTLKPLLHRQQECIGIYFEKSAAITAAIRRNILTKWSQTSSCWYVPLTKENYTKLSVALKGVATTGLQELHNYLTDKKQKPGNVAIQPTFTISIAKNKGPGPAENSAINNYASPTRHYHKADPINPVNLHVMTAMKQKLTLKAYSSSTIKTYLNELSQLLQTIKNICADDLNAEQLRRYLVYCYEKLKLSENTLHSRINAMKFYYEQVLGREKFFWEIPRPKKPLLLPRLLNEKELSALFNALENKKHKAILFTVYSAGLRVSEVVNLKIADIDSVRMQIMIARAKGKKERYVNLSPVLLDILRKYITTYKPRPQNFLFESEQTLTAYPVRTVQQIFATAKSKAGIRKEVGIHSLRHSFATHLLDKGTDIKYIKDLLGHFDIRTTERYLHVSKKQLVNIVSPFDDLWNKEQIDW